MTSESVKVIVRCRPMNEREKNLKCESVIFMDSKRGFCQIKNQADAKAPPKSFTFDGSYGIDSTTEQIYNEIGYPLVEGVTEGYNGTIFAYGQTGCGKSYTMQGVKTPSSQRGIIPRAFDHIFETISLADKMKFLVHSSYCEIYNEEIHDLLGKDAKAKLDLKEHPDKGVYVQGLSMHPVHNVSECERVMEKGWKNRATGATLMNNDSSRSHSIFSIHLEMITQDDEGEEHIRAGKLNLVDLAGSERQAKTGATGDRLKEATKINLSLSALGNVISALVDGKSKHIPYRDSKLTRLLQDSLGGNTKTLMVACLSPADNNYEETLSTLRYANRAKNIKNKPKINEDPKDALLREYQEEIERLKAMLMGQIPVPSGAFDTDGVPAVTGRKSHDALPSESSETTREDLELEKTRIREEYDMKLQDIQAMYEEEKINKAKLQQDMFRLREFYDDRLSTLDGQLAHIPTTAEVLGEPEWNNQDQSHSSKKGMRRAKSKENAAVSGVSLGGAASGTMPPGVGRFARTSTEVGVAAPRTDPRSLQQEHLPEGPGVYDHRSPEDDPLQVVSVTSTHYPDEAMAAIYNNNTAHQRNSIVTQRAVHLSSSKGEVSGGGVSLPNVEREPLPPDHMELLKSLSSNPEKVAQMHTEAVNRLHELQMQMVGGENADNEEIRARHAMRGQVATDKQLELAKAINKMDDDGIMIKIYGNIQNELCDKADELEIEQKKNEALKMEIKDLQAEFELDRTDYLDTIRKQERQLQLYQLLIDRIHPCVRRDSNYSNLDKIKSEAKWDEDNHTWLLPKLSMERNNLPNAGVMPGGRPDSKSRTYLMMNGDQTSDDRLRRRLEHSNENMVDTYFQSRRASHLLSQPPPDNNNHIVRKAKQQLGHSNGIQIQQERYATMNGGGLMQEDIVNMELRAAQVHGTINTNPEEALLQRRPQKLESLPTQTGKKSKKKRNALEPI